MLMKREVAERIVPRLGRLVEGFQWELTVRGRLKRVSRSARWRLSHRPRASGGSAVFQPARVPGIAYRNVAALLKVYLDRSSEGGRKHGQNRSQWRFAPSKKPADRRLAALARRTSFLRLSNLHHTESAAYSPKTAHVSNSARRLALEQGADWRCGGRLSGDHGQGGEGHGHVGFVVVWSTSLPAW